MNLRVGPDPLGQGRRRLGIAHVHHVQVVVVGEVHEEMTPRREGAPIFHGAHAVDEGKGTLLRCDGARPDAVARRADGKVLWAQLAA
jgi:hypothetical protein